MKIQLISDVHTEFHRDNGVSFIESLDPTDVDVLVVAGDLTTEPLLSDTLDLLCAKYPHVVYVEGNHEFYGSNREQVMGTLEKAQDRLDNFHWLHETTTTINGQRFVGTTLWFPEDPMGKTRERMLNDFVQIRGFRNWVYNINRKAVAFLNTEVGPDDVVVTHHVPSHEANHPRWANSLINCFFVTPMDELIMTQQPKLWFFGHTHDSRDVHMGDTRLVCNPFGYARYEENAKFDARKILEV